MMVPLPTNIASVLPPYQAAPRVFVPHYQLQIHISMQNYATTPLVALTYPRYELPKVAFFDKKAAPQEEPETNMASEFEVMKKKMSQLSDELTKMKLSQGQNQNYQCLAPNQSNNYAQNLNRDYGS